MRRTLNTGTLAAVGLVVLALAALLLSGAALLQHRGGATAEPAEPPGTEPSTSEATSSPGQDPSEPDTEPALVDPGGESVSPSANGGATVVVIGDSHSVGDPSTTWVGPASEQLGWGAVTNLSSPGRGFVRSPRVCDFSPCGTFGQSIPLIVAEAPDIVITFGGTADGDYSLAEAAAAYFAALRDELPDAELIAINPVTSDGEAPYWLTLHQRTVGAGVEAVGGQIIDVGQPGIGDGESLSPEAQAEIARLVVEQLNE